MAYYTYILESEMDGTYYIGSSRDPEKRLEKHNQPHHGYTGRKQPWKLVYTEPYGTKSEALRREIFLKRQKNRDLISDLNSCSSDGYHACPDLLRFYLFSSRLDHTPLFSAEREDSFPFRTYLESLHIILPNP